MVRWVDVVVGDYNYYFDRSAMLYALTVNHNWRVCVLVDEAHNLYGRACGMYSATLTDGDTQSAHSQVPPVLRPRVTELLNQWQLLGIAAERKEQPPVGMAAARRGADGLAAQPAALQQRGGRIPE